MAVLRLLTIALAVVTTGLRAGVPEAKPLEQAFNVLFIAVDDLRPQLGCYGDPVVRSPNIDRLAKRGLVFRRAYCQQALCSPSRTSLLTGRRPDTTRVYDMQVHFRKTLPDVVTLPQYFKQHGYHTQALGKVYHQEMDDPASWSVPHWAPALPDYGPEGEALRKRNTGPGHRGPAYEAPDIPDEALPDGAVANRAIEVLQQVKDRRFFLAVGFLKPHLPWAAPKRYWDLYRRDRLRPAANPVPPKDAPRYALGGQEKPYDEWGWQNEPRDYAGMPKSGPVTDEEARTLIHGYLACISYMDAQVGRLLDELDRLGLREKTIVVLFGDNGWQNGEHGMWCKHSNYETSVRVPLIVSSPVGRRQARRRMRWSSWSISIRASSRRAGCRFRVGWRVGAFCRCSTTPAGPGNRRHSASTRSGSRAPATA